jgi:hypothetical protein
MGDVRRRLDRLERDFAGPEPEASPKDRARTLQDAEQSIERSRREGGEPVFEITPSGEVLCTHDGRPVEDWHQTLAEEWYWMQVEYHTAGVGHFTHDQEAQAFYTSKGELALSRTACHLDRLFNGL